MLTGPPPKFHGTRDNLQIRQHRTQILTRNQTLINRAHPLRSTAAQLSRPFRFQHPVTRIVGFSLEFSRGLAGACGAGSGRPMVLIVA